MIYRVESDCPVHPVRYMFDGMKDALTALYRLADLYDGERCHDYIIKLKVEEGDLPPGFDTITQTQKGVL